jgi:hypothetical protein
MKTADYGDSDANPRPVKKCISGWSSKNRASPILGNSYAEQNIISKIPEEIKVLHITYI